MLIKVIYCQNYHFVIISTNSKESSGFERSSFWGLKELLRFLIPPDSFAFLDSEFRLDLSRTYTILEFWTSTFTKDVIITFCRSSSLDFTSCLILEFL